MKALSSAAFVLALTTSAGAQEVVSALVHPNPSALQPGDARIDLPQPPRGAVAVPPKHGMPEIRQVAGRELPRPPATELPASAPQGGFSIFRNTTFLRASSEVAEPTCAHSGPYGIQTANFYAYTTADDGGNWAYVNPYTRFTASDGGFCCDQFVLHVPHAGPTGAVVWLLQYSYSAATQTNRLRLCFMTGSGIGSASGCVYDLTPSHAGYPAGTWFDFPHLGYSDRWLYVTANVFNAAGTWQGSAVTRLALADMLACIPAASQSFRSTTVGSHRFVQRMRPAADMVFAGHVDNGRLRLYRWSDSGSTPVARDVAVAAWYWGTTAVVDPDGRSFTSRSDNRLQGAWDNDVHVGFMWYSNQGGNYPRPHVRVAWFDRGTFDLAGEHAIWNSELAFAYPSVAPNIHGHLGGSIAAGGGTLRPMTLAWVVDDTNCWSGLDSGPIAIPSTRLSGDLWGDYYQTQCNPQRPTTWLTTGMAMTLQSNLTHRMETRNVEFGRVSTVLTLRDLSVRAVGAVGAAITIDRTDNYCRSGGVANFVRTYRSSSLVNLTAAASAGGKSFHRWRRNGSDMPVGQTSVAVTMTADSTVEAIYGEFSAGSVDSFGAGCRGSAPQTLLLVAGSLPEIGRTVPLAVSRGPAMVGAVVFLGASRTLWSGVPLPLRLLPGSCHVYTDVAVSLPGVTNASGGYTVPLVIPNSSALVASTAYAQGLAIDGAAPNPYSIITSNALTLGIGGWVF